MLIDGLPLVGLSAHGRHGSVTVTCLNSVSATDGRLRPHLFIWAVQKGGHGGESIAISVLAALAESSVGIEVDELKGSLCLVGGDGAIVLGGAAKKTRALRPLRFCGVKSTEFWPTLSATSRRVWV